MLSVYLILLLYVACMICTLSHEVDPHFDGIYSSVIISASVLFCEHFSTNHWSQCQPLQLLTDGTSHGGSRFATVLPLLDLECLLMLQAFLSTLFFGDSCSISLEFRSRQQFSHSSSPTRLLSGWSLATRVEMEISVHCEKFQHQQPPSSFNHLTMSASYLNIFLRHGFYFSHWAEFYFSHWSSKSFLFFGALKYASFSCLFIAISMWLMGYQDTCGKFICLYVLLTGPPHQPQLLSLNYHPTFFPSPLLVKLFSLACCIGRYAMESLGDRNKGHQHHSKYYTGLLLREIELQHQRHELSNNLMSNSIP